MGEGFEREFENGEITAIEAKVFYAGMGFGCNGYGGCRWTLGTKIEDGRVGFKQKPSL